MRVARYRLMARSSSPAIGCSTESEFLRRSTQRRERLTSAGCGVDRPWSARCQARTPWAAAGRRAHLAGVGVPGLQIVEADAAGVVSLAVETSINLAQRGLSRLCPGRDAAELAGCARRPAGSWWPGWPAGRPRRQVARPQAWEFDKLSPSGLRAVWPPFGAAILEGRQASPWARLGHPWRRHGLLAGLHQMGLRGGMG